MDQDGPPRLDRDRHFMSPPRSASCSADRCGLASTECRDREPGAAQSSSSRPWSASMAEPERPQDPGVPVPSAGLRILVVDDNRDSAESLALMLQMIGHDARSVPDGLSGLETAQAFRPEVMFLDIAMPRLNGYDLARRIRAQQWGRGL